MLESSIQNIYQHLQDEESRRIFEDRLMYSLTGDDRFIRRLLGGLPEKKLVDAAMDRIKRIKNPLVVYGAGTDFEHLLKAYPDFSCTCLCDGDAHKQKTGWNGYSVISPAELAEKYRGCHVLIGTSRYWMEIYEFLLENNWETEKILMADMMKKMYESQYFEPEIVKPCNDEVFVDGGCFNCSTDRQFIRWCGNKYRRIYAFEPDGENYSVCQIKAKAIQRLELWNYGLWSKRDELYFHDSASQNSRIMERTDSETSDPKVADSVALGSETMVRVTTIDEVVKKNRVTFIKLDVEGAELEALKGARDTIIRERPKLAICVYHKKEDIWEIPEYILSLSQEYRLYIRHYHWNPSETVLYAV